VDFGDPLRSLIPSLDGAVLAVLAGTGRPMTGARIARLSSKGSDSGIRLVLERLVREGLVVQERIDRSSLYSLNREHLLWPAIDAAFTARQEFERRLAATVEQWRRPPIGTIVYGSAPSGQAGPDADIDVLLIVHDDELETDLGGAIERWTGNRAHLLVLREDEVIAEAAANPALADAWRHGRRVQGSTLSELLGAER